MCVTYADRCEIGQNRVLTTAFRPFSAHNRKSPILVVIVGIRSEKLRISTTDYKLQVMLATEAKRSSTTLIELALHELDVHFVALAERQNGSRNFPRGLAFAAVRDSQIHDWPRPGTAQSDALSYLPD